MHVGLADAAQIHKAQGVRLIPSVAGPVIITFRHVSTPLRICTYAQLPQAMKTRQTCRKACRPLKHCWWKPYMMGAYLCSPAYFCIPDTVSAESCAGSLLCCPLFRSIGIRKRTHSVRSHRGPESGHETSKERCTPDSLPRCQHSVPRGSRRS